MAQPKVRIGTYWKFASDRYGKVYNKYREGRYVIIGIVSPHDYSKVTTQYLEDHSYRWWVAWMPLRWALGTNDNKAFKKVPMDTIEATRGNLAGKPVYAKDVPTVWKAWFTAHGV